MKIRYIVIHCSFVPLKWSKKLLVHHAFTLTDHKTSFSLLNLKNLLARWFEQPISS